MEIRVYDSELYFQGVIENQTSLIWTRKYFETGEFELYTPTTEDNLKLIKIGNIIWMRGSDDAGVIEDIKLEESNVKNEIIVKGRFLSSYMDRKLIKGPYNFKGTVEEAMRELFYRAPIPSVSFGKLQNFPETVEFQVTYKCLLTYENKLARSAALGYRFRPDFDKRIIIFEVYKGVDRTVAQGVNNRVIFSESYNNLNNAIYRENTQLYKNVAYVGGEGEGSRRKIVVVGDEEWLERREIFVDAKDIDSEGLSDDEYEAKLRTRGEEALASNRIEKTFECNTGADSNFQYKKNYDLGDIVTVKKNKWGITINERITEIREIYEYGGRRIELTFGNALPESIDWSDK